MNGINLPEKRTIALPYYILLAFLCHVWLLYYYPEAPDRIWYISFALQQFCVISLFFLVDSLASDKLNFAIACGAFLYVLQVLFSALILTITSINLVESWTIQLRNNTVQDFLFLLGEAGFSPPVFFAIIVTIYLASLMGGILRRLIPKITAPQWTVTKLLPALSLILTASFIAEQAISRNSIHYFSRRDLPGYIELFRESRYSLTVPMPKQMPDAETVKLLKEVQAPANPGNVVVFILESFRYDMINKDICPALFDLSRTSLSLDRPYGDSIYTSLTWNVLFMDRPAYAIERDIRSGENPGSIILKIFRKAGYTTHLLSSANFEWHRFHQRVAGKENLLDSYYCAYEHHKEDDRNIIDRATAGRAVELIRSLRGSKKPFVIFIQLDSTHFTYFFDKDAELYKTYPKSVGLLEIRESEHIASLFNRYKNAARNVDNRIGEIITALKEAGLYERTVVAAVSDHGEGFAPGRIGHTVFHEDIRKMMLLLRLPGIGPKKVEAPVSHRDIFPTIFDYLNISGAKKLLLGDSALGAARKNKCILTIHGSTTLSELNCFDRFIYFRTRIGDHSITFTPYRVTDKLGRMEKISRIPVHCDWRKEVRDSISGGKRLP